MSSLWTGYEISKDGSSYGQGAYSANSGSSTAGYVNYGQINQVATVSGDTLWVSYKNYSSSNSDYQSWGHAAKLTSSKISLNGKTKVTATFKVDSVSGDSAYVKIRYSTALPTFQNGTTSAAVFFNDNYSDLWVNPKTTNYEAAYIRLGRTSITTPSRGNYGYSGDVGKNTKAGQTVTITRTFSGLTSSYYIMFLLYQTGSTTAKVTLNSISVS